MEKVVYVFGAGFSAPLGLPLVSNFRAKSQDMFLEEPKKFAYFEKVFETVRAMSVGKNLFDADLYNIEEILSTLEMGDFLNGGHLRQEFINYIIDVVNYYTPPIKPYDKPTLPGNWQDWVFGYDEMWRAYGCFIANLLNTRFFPRSNFNGTPESLICQDNSSQQADYSVITLNYDIIPEMICDFCTNSYGTGGAPISFSQAEEESKQTHNRHGAVWLAKLHGCVRSKVIVPPTWSKGNNQAIVPAWKLAHNLLKEATHIRIIGYSLPVADAYVKYLFKSAGIENHFLKRIDVICLDGDGSVKQRYDNFIKFNGYRFVNSNTKDYLNMNQQQQQSDQQKNNNAPEVSFNSLEKAHEVFMNYPNR